MVIAFFDVFYFILNFFLVLESLILTYQEFY
jgi:hypothetical protein